MCGVNEPVEIIVKEKASRIMDSKGHTKHIEEFLEYFFNGSGVNFKDIPADVFKICTVDAMIFDVGAALDFPEWKSRKQRRRMLEEIFPKK